MSWQPPMGPRPPHSRGFSRPHTRRSTVRKTLLDEWSAQCRDLYMRAHNAQNRQISMPTAGLEPASERPQTDALDRAATAFGVIYTDKWSVVFIAPHFVNFCRQIQIWANLRANEHSCDGAACTCLSVLLSHTCSHYMQNSNNEVHTSRITIRTEHMRKNSFSPQSTVQYSTLEYSTV